MSKKVPLFDVAKLMEEQTAYLLKNAQNEIINAQKKYRQNHELLSKLIAAGFAKPSTMNLTNIRYCEHVEIRESQLTKVRDAIGNMKEHSKELANAKRRMVRIVLSFPEYPESTIRVTYLHKYTKEEESTKPCKIEMVEVEPAREATPPRFLPQLICHTQ